MQHTEYMKKKEYCISKKPEEFWNYIGMHRNTQQKVISKFRYDNITATNTNDISNLFARNNIHNR